VVTKRDKDLTRAVEELGYEHDRTNSKGHSFYVHPDTGYELKVIPGSDERRYRGVLSQARQLIGLPTKDGKRNPTLIKQRAMDERERASRTLQKAREQLDLLRLSHVDEQRIRTAEAAVLREERKYQWWDKLMRQVA